MVGKKARLRNHLQSLTGELTNLLFSVDVYVIYCQAIRECATHHIIALDWDYKSYLFVVCSHCLTTLSIFLLSQTYPHSILAIVIHLPLNLSDSSRI